MLSLKERWGVSVGAMIMRCKSLDILDDLSAKRLWMNYARRRWRKGEPLTAKWKMNRLTSFGAASKCCVKLISNPLPTSKTLCHSLWRT